MRGLLVVLTAVLVHSTLLISAWCQEAQPQTKSSQAAIVVTPALSSGAPWDGMFILNPPVNDKGCDRLGYPSACYSAHVVPTLICTGKGTPSGYNCGQRGAGTAYVKGAVFQVPWNVVNPGNGSYDFSVLDRWMQPWVDAGKLTSFIFQPTSFGTRNGFTPPWYLQAVNISSVSQAGGIITVQSATDMEFFPGGINSAAGLEIQISGTGTALDGNGTPANPGLWVVCDQSTPGCQNPSLRKVYAIGAGNDIAPVRRGTLGNPLYGSSDGSTCTSGMVPIQWRVNFMKAWQAFIQAAVSHYRSNSQVGYLRFGMGIGGQTNPTLGIDRVACQAQMTAFGFTSVAAPWPNPDNPRWGQVSARWIAYLKTMSQYMGSLKSPKPILLTISPITFTVVDLSTPDATAANAVAAGLGIGNQGLQKHDPLNFAIGRPCIGGNWCANFQKFRGQVPLELQTMFYSDPTNASRTGSLTNLLPFATNMGARILELYVDDWLCTYDNSWSGNSTHAACASAGYPAVFSATAARLK